MAIPQNVKPASIGLRLSAYDRRAGTRFRFSHDVSAQVIGIDGTWRRSCTVADASDSGARLKVEGSLKGLRLKEFFLLLSSRGLAYRRCELVWVNGDEIGVSFLRSAKNRKATGSQDG